ncbi:MAG: protoporphyrinogen oxidase [Proteobacteria bacterium]|nr:protoporphyrinogen oxidase [Pseudomonadota bacterium]MBU1685781.1 protoporphyrinogen oxidase [Pseudomonadota bacterium]
MSTKHPIVIIGGGLSGLSVAHFLKKQQPDRDLILFEQQQRPGGAIQTFRHEAYQAEWGPHGFLNNTPESQELLTDTGLDTLMQTAPLGDFKRFLCHQGHLEPLPQSPKMLLTTPLLSLTGKLRLLADLWTKPRLQDQTIADWARHRFGPGVLPMVDVAVTGTFAGDYERLSIDAVMPGVRQLEKETGSVLRGLKKKKKMGSGEKKLPSMINFPTGMETLITTLAEGLNIHLSTSINKINHTPEGWRIKSDQGEVLAAKLVVATPLNHALSLLAHLLPPPVASIPVARINNIILAFSAQAEIPRGFGYLAPEGEQRFALGAMFSSHMFPARCPEGQHLVEALVGGRRHPERLELSDNELIDRVCEDLGQLMNLSGPPVFARVLRPQSGIPQLEMDHPALLLWRRQLEGTFPGLLLSGFGWDGIGMNEMIKAAAQTARKLTEEHGGTTESVAVKPVYF